MNSYYRTLVYPCNVALHTAGFGVHRFLFIKQDYLPPPEARQFIFLFLGNKMNLPCGRFCAKFSTLPH